MPFIKKTGFKTKTSKLRKDTNSKGKKQSMSKKSKSFLPVGRTKRKHWPGPVNKGAVCIKNLPHGFYESSLYNFFDQFGNITRYRVARSNKNAKPMGYAYIEFENQKVAKIVANTMNNYLMYNKIIKCRYIDVMNIKDKMFANSKLHPEFCTGTKRKLRNQYKMEHVNETSLKSKLMMKTSSSLRKLSKMLGKKIEQEPELITHKLQEFEVEIDSEQISKSSAVEISKSSAVENNEENLMISEVKSPKSLKKKSRRSKEMIASKEEWKVEPLTTSGRKSMLESPKRKRKQETLAETPLVMEIDEVDEEIYVKTPPNVIKVIRKGIQKVICDDAATTIKRPLKKIKLGPLENVTNKLFSDAKNSPSVKKARKRHQNKAKITEPVSVAKSKGFEVESTKVQKTPNIKAFQSRSSGSNKAEKSTNEAKKATTAKKSKAKKRSKDNDFASVLTNEKCVNISEKKAKAESTKKRRKSSNQ